MRFQEKKQGRCIGIRHRVKQTKDGEARPTQMVIFENDEFTSYDLDDDNAELDFVRGRFPVSFRAIDATDNLANFNPRHIKWRTVKVSEDESKLNPAHTRKVEGKPQVATKVPVSYDGLKSGDVVGMSMGGSGDRFAYALSRVGERVGATVFRLPPFELKRLRVVDEKDGDARLLAILVRDQRGLFHEVTATTRRIINVRESQSLRIDAMKGRIACGQRLEKAMVGRVFCTEGDFAELDFEAAFAELKANDRIYTGLLEEEGQRLRALDAAVKDTSVWQEILEDVKGIGPALAGRIISAVGTIERFMVEPDQTRMDALYEESVKLELEGKFNELQKYVQKGESTFQTLQRVASWCRANSRPSEAAKLGRAVECHEERSKLRRDARNKTRGKLKAFCGVHLQLRIHCGACEKFLTEADLIDGKTGEPSLLCPKCGSESIVYENVFARRRGGSVSNWHPDARQAFYLLAKEQFNRQSNRTRWGAMLIHYKGVFRAKHPPETDPETGKSRYSDGHIHNMAIWRTATKFVEWLADQWSDLARRQKLNTERAKVKAMSAR